MVIFLRKAKSRSLFCLLLVMGARFRLLVVQPVVNIDDPVGKVVGKRANLTQQNYIDYAMSLQNSLRGFPQPKFPRGVFRFKTHEDADQWLMDHLIRKPAN